MKVHFSVEKVTVSTKYYCKGCKQWVSVSLFSINKQTGDFYGHCNPCREKRGK